MPIFEHLCLGQLYSSLHLVYWLTIVGHVAYIYQPRGSQLSAMWPITVSRKLLYILILFT